MSFLSGLGHFFGISSPGSTLNPADRATETSIQTALDKLVTGPKAFGNRTMSADQAEQQLRTQGILPDGWRLRESDSTSSGYRPTQAATKKMGALHAAEIGGAAFGGAGALGFGPLASGSQLGSVLSNPWLQGGVRTGIDAATGRLSPLSALNFAGAVPGFNSLAPSLTSNPLGQKAIGLGVNTGLNAARTGSFSPVGTLASAGSTFLPNLSQSLTSNPLGQGLLNYGGTQGLNLATGKFNPFSASLGAVNTLRSANPAASANPWNRTSNIYSNYLGG